MVGPRLVLHWPLLRLRRGALNRISELWMLKPFGEIHPGRCQWTENPLADRIATRPDRSGNGFQNLGHQTTCGLMRYNRRNEADADCCRNDQ